MKLLLLLPLLFLAFAPASPGVVVAGITVSPTTVAVGQTVTVDIYLLNLDSTERAFRLPVLLNSQEAGVVQGTVEGGADLVISVIIATEQVGANHVSVDGLALYFVAVASLPYNNTEALAYNLDLLRSHPELAPCVEWAEAHNVRYNQEWAIYANSAVRPQPAGWYAYPPDQVVYPPVIEANAETAAIILHEIGHLASYNDPDVFFLELWAAEILGVQDLQPIRDREADYRAVLGDFYRPFLGYGEEGEPVFMSFSSKALNWRGQQEVRACDEW